jgi:2,4-dienoyl-CoA reductase-like NADH-dependent reductase (Old Yellow Enzyme family)
MPKLFEPIKLRDLEVKNRIWISPMCQYSCENQDGMPGSWQQLHLGSRAIGGAGLIIVEASGVAPEGRITPWCTGIWNDEQATAWKTIVDICHSHGSKVAMQLAHAGRKASVHREWSGVGTIPVSEGGWESVSATDVAFGDYAAPRRLTVPEIQGLVQAFAESAKRAVGAGFDAVEIHGAHGYLIHQFLSPISNDRDDEYGGSLENRARLLMEVIDAVRNVIPKTMPLFLRLSATDYADNGWDPDQTAEVSGWAADRGVDLIDVSSGGLITGVKIPSGPGYQVPFAKHVSERIKQPVSAVGQITEAKQAEEILQSGQVDVILIGRASLRDPYWPLRAAHELGAEVAWPAQYERGAWPKASTSK